MASHGKLCLCFVVLSWFRLSGVHFVPRNGRGGCLVPVV